MPYRLVYSETSGKQIQSLHPGIKSLVRGHIQKLKENPFHGKPLERELAGYYSLRTKKFRVIYKIDPRKQLVQIHYVGYRKDVYQLFKEFLDKGL